MTPRALVWRYVKIWQEQKVVNIHICKGESAKETLISWWDFSDFLSRWWLSCIACYQLWPQSDLYSTKVAGRKTFHSTLGFRRCLGNCKIPRPLTSPLLNKPPELAKSLSDAAPSRLQRFCTTFKVLPTWWFQFRHWPELEVRFTLFSFHAFPNKLFSTRFSYSPNPNTQNVFCPHIQLSLECYLLFVRQIWSKCLTPLDAIIIVQLNSSGLWFNI